MLLLTTTFLGSCVTSRLGHREALKQLNKYCPETIDQYSIWSTKYSKSHPDTIIKLFALNFIAGTPHTSSQYHPDSNFCLTGMSRNSIRELFGPPDKSGEIKLKNVDQKMWMDSYFYETKPYWLSKPEPTEFLDEHMLAIYYDLETLEVVRYWYIKPYTDWLKK